MIEKLLPEPQPNSEPMLMGIASAPILQNPMLVAVLLHTFAFFVSKTYANRRPNPAPQRIQAAPCRATSKESLYKCLNHISAIPSKNVAVNVIITTGLRSSYSFSFVSNAVMYIDTIVIGIARKKNRISLELSFVKTLVPKILIIIAA